MGSFWMKPTVSENRTSRPPLSSTRRVVGSSVANSLSSARMPAPVSVLMSVDLPGEGGGGARQGWGAGRRGQRREWGAEGRDEAKQGGRGGAGGRAGREPRGQQAAPARLTCVCVAHQRHHRDGRARATLPVRAAVCAHLQAQGGWQWGVRAGTSGLLVLSTTRGRERACCNRACAGWGGRAPPQSRASAWPCAT